ncbi:MAG: PIN domain-containing protein [Chloroflexi bacterium]|nr:MAG: PIN domain-containing protein [Chloroflexota bacterium]
MSTPDLFLDSSALFAGVVSSTGASRALLLLAEAKIITITISEQVIVETEHALARKIPRAIPAYRKALRSSNLRIIPTPTLADIAPHLDIIAHQADVPVVVAAMKAQTDYLVTLNRKHFLDNPAVAQNSGLRIGMPGDALAWVRDQLK